MKLRIGLVGFYLLIPFSAQANTARDILAESGVKGGVVAHLGCGDGLLTADLLANDSFLVHGLDRDVEKAKQAICTKGVYGEVSASKLVGCNLPYAGNTINLLVVEDPCGIAEDELMRVLAPRGVLMQKTSSGWKKSVKPVPGNIDEWSHYLHGADNNAVANDTVVAPPRHLQWIQAPLLDRHHDTIGGFRALVSAGGRIFSIEDTAPWDNPYWPGEWHVKARDAFNGKLLWSRTIDDWAPVSRPIRTGPVQQPRRLVAVGDSVFVTLGRQAPVTALDAATGETLKTYDGTENTQEILFDNGTLFLVVGDPTYPQNWEGLYSRSEELGHDLKNDPWVVEGSKCSVMALDAVSGKKLWEKSDADTAGYWAMSLTVKNDRVAILNGKELLCMGRVNGEKLWTTPRTTVMKSFGTPVTVIMGEEHICVADSKTLDTYSLANGSSLWSGDEKIMHPVSGPNIYFLGGLVWQDFLGGLNPDSGEVVKPLAFPVKHGFHMSHHRCYRNKATVNYQIAGKYCVEFLPFNDPVELTHNWIRGTCQYGVMPANGLLYVPPNNCECNMSAKLNGYLALAGGAAKDTAAPDFQRLEKGAAFGRVEPEGETFETDWATFRHDARRSGVTRNAVPSNLKPAWDVKVGTKLTQPVVAAGRIYVSDIEAHTIHALDSATGKTLWTYTADGRVDSPPTIYRGQVLFGTSRGWVYALRATDGNLAWRYLAAPEQRLGGAWEQLDSAWPIHGSVLVQDGILYCAAGRCSFVDGGIYVTALKPETGEKLHETVVFGPWDEDGFEIGSPTNEKDIVGSLADILVSDGQYVYMRHKVLGLQCEQPDTMGKPHILCSAGFLDGAMNHRFGWTVDTKIGYYLASPGTDGEILCSDGRRIFAFQGCAVGRTTKFDPRDNGFRLVMSNMSKTPEGVAAAAALAEETPEEITTTVKKKKNKKEGKSPSGKKKPTGPASRGKEAIGWEFEDEWEQQIQLVAKAMVKAGENLFIAGTPNEYDELDLHGTTRGKKGGLLWAISTKDGATTAEYRLDVPPVFDGLIAAEGRLYLSLTDGRLTCWAK